MKPTFNTTARKRPVDQTLNEDLVLQARGLTSNLFEPQHQQRIAKARALEATVTMWNEFNAKHGAFADEYSSL